MKITEYNDRNDINKNSQKIKLKNNILKTFRKTQQLRSETQFLTLKKM